MVPTCVRQRFLTSNYHYHWKGRVGVASWHPVPTSDDVELIGWCQELYFHRPAKGAVEDLHCGETACRHDLRMVTYEDSEISTSVSLKGSE